MSSRARPVLPVLGVLLIVAAVAVIWRSNTGATTSEARGPAPTSTRTGGTPNVLVIMTDDQTLESMRVLDNVDRLIIDQGTSFTNYFVAFPNCCPSRTTYMTGQYPHNHNVKDNVPPAGGFHKADQDEYLPVYLQRSGYWTASVGKYLNQYGEDGNIEPPKGWSRWFGLIDPSTYRYYGYNVSEDGRQRYYGDRPEDYQTDVLGGEVVRILRERATAAEPWFVSWTPLAPHSTEGEGASGQGLGDQNGNADNKPASITDRIRANLPVPAPEFEGKMAKEALPRPPSFDQQDVSQLPSFMKSRLRIGAPLATVIREGYQRELEALLSVDKWVKRIFDTLIQTKQLENTVVMFTSDNGYFHGEHRLSFQKVHLYEEAVHLPLVIRGGAFPKGAKVDSMASNVDLTPTILGLTGATATKTVDGRDLATVAGDPAVTRGRGVLLENWRNNTKFHSEGIRTDRYKYLVSESQEEELYDLQDDPYELVNHARDPDFGAIKMELVRRLGVLRTCAGATCEGAAAH